MNTGHFLSISKTAITDQERNFLRQLLGDKLFVISLLYRGSEHGWYLKDFSSRCYNRGPTVSLYRMKNGDCIGGFTSNSWTAT
jgi:hypothetical protein